MESRRDPTGGTNGIGMAYQHQDDAPLSPSRQVLGLSKRYRRDTVKRRTDKFKAARIHDWKVTAFILRHIIIQPFPGKPSAQGLKSN